MHTPAAVAAARGTSYVVWVEDRQKRGMLVAEVRVEVKNAHEGIVGKVVISAGKMSYAEEDKPPIATGDMGPRGSYGKG